MNVNGFRSLLTVVATALVGIMAFLPQMLGCTVGLDGASYDCSGSWLPPGWVATIAGILMVLNLVLKALQGGGLIKGLVKPTVVVDSSGKPGTVEPNKVN